MAQALKLGDRVYLFDRNIMNDVHGTVVELRDDGALVQFDDEDERRVFDCEAQTFLRLKAEGH